MVEILGVLAIMGVLTLGGILGYRYAIYLTRENQTIDIINKTIAGSRTGLSEYLFGSASTEMQAVLAEQVISDATIDADEYTIKTPLLTDVGVWLPGGGEIEITLDNITYNVCRRLLNETHEYSSAYLNRNGQQWDGVYPEDSRDYKEAFCARVDTMKRTPYLPGADVNGDASIVLCYAQGEGGCVLEDRTDTPCAIPDGGEILHG